MAAKKSAKKAAEAPQQPPQGAFELPVGSARFHPGHEGVPDIPEDGFGALLASVRLQGVQTPVEVLSQEDAEARGEQEQAGAVLDGRQRIRAAQECGEETVPAVNAKIPEGMGSAEYIFRKAVERRHLTKSQLAVMAVEMKKQLKRGQGFRSDRLPEIFPEVGDSRDVAGKLAGVSGRYVSAAERLLEEAPELAEKVRRGEANLMEAVREHNQQEGKAEKPEPAGIALTTFKRLSSSFGKISKPSGEKAETYEEAQRLLQQLKEKLEALAE